MQSLPCSMLDPDISCIAGKERWLPGLSTPASRVTGEAFPVAEEVRSESIRRLEFLRSRERSSRLSKWPSHSRN